MDKPIMSPAPGERLLRFVGDRVRFSLRLPKNAPPIARALLRTNLGEAGRLRQEIIATHEEDLSMEEIQKRAAAGCGKESGRYLSGRNLAARQVEIQVPQMQAQALQ